MKNALFVGLCLWVLALGLLPCHRGEITRRKLQSAASVLKAPDLTEQILVPARLAGGG
jgi:hypothetical protein